MGGAHWAGRIGNRLHALRVAASACGAHPALSRPCRLLRPAGREGAHHPDQARHLIDGGMGQVQTEGGRIGGIGPAKTVADHAQLPDVNSVGRTFTPHLARDARGQARAPDACGLAMQAQPSAPAKDVADTDLQTRGQVLRRTPALA